MLRVSPAVVERHDVLGYTSRNDRHLTTDGYSESRKHRELVSPLPCGVNRRVMPPPTCDTADIATWKSICANGSACLHHSEHCIVITYSVCSS